MKKIKLFITIIVLVLIIPNVSAATISTDFSGANNLNVENISKVYLKLKTSSSFNKIDISYNTNSNMKIIGVTPLGGFKEISSYGNRLIMESDKLVSSGTAVLAFTVEGKTTGKGLLKINSLKVTIDGALIDGGSSSYEIVINPLKTDEELLDETNKTELEKANILVEAAEKSELQDDYDAAYNSVNILINSTEKTKLKKRLEKVKFNISVKKECKVTDTNLENTQQIMSPKSWILVSGGLAFVVIFETIGLIIKKKNYYE